MKVSKIQIISGSQVMMEYTMKELKLLNKVKGTGDENKLVIDMPFSIKSMGQISVVIHRKVRSTNV